MNSAISLFKNTVFTHFVKVAVLPSLVLFSVKVVTLLALGVYYNLTYTFQDNAIYFSSSADFVNINDYSSAFAFLFVYSFTVWLVFKAFFFHKTHIHPRLSAWLHNQEMSYLISGSLDLYIRIVVWLVFTWLSVALIFIHFLLGLSSLWLIVTCALLAFVLTIFVIIDFERDYKMYAKEKLDIKLLEYNL